MWLTSLDCSLPDLSQLSVPNNPNSTLLDALITRKCQVRMWTDRAVERCQNVLWQSSPYANRYALKPLHYFMTLTISNSQLNCGMDFHRLTPLDGQNMPASTTGWKSARDRKRGRAIKRFVLLKINGHEGSDRWSLWSREHIVYISTTYRLFYTTKQQSVAHGDKGTSIEIYPGN
jgi:hypothetical protein